MPTEAALMKTVARNIATLRKRNKLTQAQLAEKINYSDKSISKWERAEGMPDVLVLVTLSELFHVSLDALCYDTVPQKPAQKDKRHFLILLLSVGLVWLIATLVFVALKMLNVFWPNAWLLYIYAIPASAIVAVVFTAIWFTWYALLISVSALIWSIPLSISLSIAHPQTYLLYIVAGVLQLLTLFWFWLRWERQRAKKQQERAMTGPDAQTKA